MNRIVKSKYILYFVCFCVIIIFLYIITYGYQLKNYPIIIINNNELDIKELRITYDSEEFIYDTSIYRKITIIKPLLLDEYIEIQILTKKNNTFKKSIYISGSTSIYNVYIEKYISISVRDLMPNELIFYWYFKDSTLLRD